ncbi:hypothetical protein [Bizionia psychrotolerans]|uniref:hypothetical protein n=1 Tax=Bizionia psychrotolerans TaxID=1492901 RepID=UPI0006523EA3|nr:hypothetical protein [Bizionia psychrotolerans]
MKRFVLVNGYVELTNDKILVDEKSKEIKDKGGFIGILFIIIIVGLFQDIKKYFEFTKNSDYVGFGIRALGFLAILYLIYYFIFKKAWSKNITINTIKNIKIEDGEFETEVIITFLNNREKALQFRKLENQLEPFLEELKKRNSRMQITHERI